MQETTETPIEQTDSETYKASLLVAFKTKSKYSILWQELKQSRILNLQCNPRIYKHHKQFSDSLGRLHKIDLPFKEFCRLHYGEELCFFSRHNKETDSLTIKLLTSEQYRQELRLACTKDKLKAFE